jgi:hypothetical protein
MDITAADRTPRRCGKKKNHVSSIEKVSHRLGLKYQEQNKENYLGPVWLPFVKV